MSEGGSARRGFDLLRQALVKVTVAANRRELRDSMRTLMARAALSAKLPGGFPKAVEDIEALMALKEAETDTWVTPATMLQSGGRFDACNLQHWLALADAAGISTVPARPILTLSEPEIAMLAGKADIPETAVTRKVSALASALVRDMSGKPLPEGAEEQAQGVNVRKEAERMMDSSLKGNRQFKEPDPASEIAWEKMRAAVAEKTYAAMDGVPEGWMVRHERCGPSVLKTLAGSGTIDGKSPEVDFGPDLTVGPGWIRNGNRRRVDVTDQRTMRVAIGQGPDAPHTWLARPWVSSSRWTHCEDPHRYGGPLQGPGFWPAEWRVFVELGRVTGVSYYYPWAGMSGPADASRALAVRDVAQRMVDAAVALGAVPAFMDVEFARNNPQFAQLGLDERLPREGFACCLDFLEVEGADGNTDFAFLEGGPPLCPFGGAHPCGFISIVGRTHKAEGVALTLPHGVHMLEPSTWDVPTEGAILTWEEAEALAASVPSTSPRR
jgi:hypothetical protein